jgi:DNA (cytosine-5)-methyltransferase 1
VNKANRYSVVDLFSGAGGLELGFEQSGYDILFSTDIDEYCEKVHLLNRPSIPFVRSDIRDIDETVLDKYVHQDIDVLVGGPPCQGFSTIGKRISSDPIKRSQKDPRNVLFREYIRVLKLVSPKIFLMENVVGLLTREKGKIFEEIRRSFHETGYDFDYVILNAADYGVPQIRNRVFFYGNKIGVKLVPPISHWSEIGDIKWRTVGDVIGDLASIDIDRSINHVPLKHGAINLRRYQMIPEGGRMPEKDLPDELYRRNFGNTFKRLHRDKPSLTMVPGHNAFPIHPWLNRSLTVREAARIQTFPDDYIFVGPRDKQCMQVGNAVPPMMAKAWADYIKGVLNEHYAKS